MIPLIVAQGVGGSGENLVEQPLVIGIIIIIWNRRNCYYPTSAIMTDLSVVKFRISRKSIISRTWNRVNLFCYACWDPISSRQLECQSKLVSYLATYRLIFFTSLPHIAPCPPLARDMIDTQSWESVLREKRRDLLMMVEETELSIHSIPITHNISPDKNMKLGH